MSHLSQVRGLKRAVVYACRHQYVAPLAGAWIETSTRHIIVGWAKVAPLAGAWIETTKDHLQYP